jgi:hypothetical protein
MKSRESRPPVEWPIRWRGLWSVPAVSLPDGGGGVGADGHHLGLHAPPGELRLEEVSDVAEVDQLPQVGEAEEAGDEVDVVLHGHSSTPSGLLARDSSSMRRRAYGAKVPSGTGVLVRSVRDDHLSCGPTAAIHSPHLFMR